METRLSTNTYLTALFQDKDAVKALGARWDGVQRQWYVPSGRELAPFAAWLPVGIDGTEHAQDAAGELLTTRPQPLASSNHNLPELSTQKGVSLSSLLAGVSRAVAQAYKAGIWTLVEVVELRINGAHVFMGVSERDASGSVLAKASAVIWQSTANTILPEFERATGVKLASGIKLLVRAHPVFKPQHGFIIEIDAIDHEYTLGDLEAKLRRIRERLQSEGVFTANKQLPPPWDFNAVLVVAPAGGAGFGDFQAEAKRLQQHGICSFTYAYSRFQGEGAAKEICDTLQAAVSSWRRSNPVPLDAVVIIRGGGAANDLAWLNDYDLARYICDLPIPVLTGIGHERDSTVLDEVANIRFDTPSKAAAGIEQVIAKRAAESKVNHEVIHNRTKQMVQAIAAQSAALEVMVRTESMRHLSQGSLSISNLVNGLRVDALQLIRVTSETSRETLQVVKTAALTQLFDAKREVPIAWGDVSQRAGHAIRVTSETSRETLQVVKTAALTQLFDAKREVPIAWGQIAQGAGYAIQTSRTLADSTVDGIQVQVGRAAVQSKTDIVAALETVRTNLDQNLREATDRAEALMREIAGQGTEKTLKRGFALVRAPDGNLVTRASQTTPGTKLEIAFCDGKVVAVTH